jgi:transposase
LGGSSCRHRCCEICASASSKQFDAGRRGPLCGQPVLDNLAAHKVAGIEEAVAAAGASLLYLPPYSPDLNPIEQFIAKLKALLSKAAARTKEALWAAIEPSSPAEYRNFVANSGYDPA